MVDIGGWAFKLNDVIVTSGCVEFELCPGSESTVLADAALDDTPDGLGVPGLRTEDVTYAQRDGVRHFNDWYTPRIVTFRVTVGPVNADDCETGDCTSAREQLQQLLQGWKRSPEDVELVVYPPCNPGPYGFGLGPFGEGPFGGGTANDELVGPFGIVGRPRVAEAKWLYRGEQVATVLLRFDGVDQRVYVLDGCGTPGYKVCTDIDPGTDVYSLCEAALCDPICPTLNETGSVDPTTIAVGGTEVVYPELTLWPNLTDPIIENMTTGDYITYDGTITDYPVTINTEYLTAMQNGVSVTHLLGGSLTFTMSPGEFQLRMLSGSNSDTGYLTVCTRDALVSV